MQHFPTKEIPDEVENSLNGSCRQWCMSANSSTGGTPMKLESQEMVVEVRSYQGKSVAALSCFVVSWQGRDVAGLARCCVA